MVIVRTLLRACSAAPLFRLVPTTSMKVLGPCDRQVTTTATPAPSRVPAPPTWGPDVKVTLRPVSVIAKFASFIHSAADLALVSEPTWITGACWATACADRAKHSAGAIQHERFCGTYLPPLLGGAAVHERDSPLTSEQKFLPADVCVRNNVAHV